jgi:hypothetical protein
MLIAAIEDKYKDWKEFLVKRLTGARTLPSNFYTKVTDSLVSRFRYILSSMVEGFTYETHTHIHIHKTRCFHEQKNVIRNQGQAVYL